MSFKGIWIKKETWLLNDLSIMEKLFLTDIDSLDNSKRGCYASNNYFSDFFNVSKGRCSQVIKSLEIKGYIKMSYKRNGKQVIERNIKVVNKLNRVFRKLNEGSKYTKEGYLENAKENNTLLNNTEDIYDEFLRLFNKDTNRKFKILIDKAKRQIKSRLKEGFTLKDLITATNNCYNDEYHKNNRHHLTPEFITRPDKFQKYFNIENNNFTHVEYKFKGQAIIRLSIEQFKSKESIIRNNEFEIEPKYIKV